MCGSTYMINAFFWVGIGSGYTEYEELLAEKEKYNDIVLYYGRDTWENLSKKVFAMMVHADSTFEFDYFLKTDDDTFIDVQRLLEFTNGLPENRVYWGQRIKGANANPVGRWANPEYIEQMGHTSFSPYHSGAGYLLSSDIINYLRTAEEEVGLRYFSSEDVSTGHWVSALNVDVTAAEPGVLVTSLEFHESNEKCGSAMMCHKRTPDQ
eukprot:341250_1